MIGNEINVFDQNYAFLSNFYPCKINWEGRTYKSSEAAYQSAKCRNVSNRNLFINLNAAQAKRLGRKIHIDPNWDEYKDEIMYEICLAKFTQNEDLKEQLIKTYPSLLVEGNTWGDTYWGKCNGQGRNKLGKILMKIRDEFINKNIFEQ